MADPREKTTRYLQWDGTYGNGDYKIGTANGGFAGHAEANKAQEISKVSAAEAMAEVTAQLRGKCCFSLSRPKRKVSVRILQTDRFFRPVRERVAIKVRLKREYHITSLLLRIYRNYSATSRALPADHLVYQEVLGYNELSQLPTDRPATNPPSGLDSNPEWDRRDFEKTAKQGNGRQWAAWEHTPFKVRIWVSSELSPAQLFDHVQARSDPPETRGQNAHDQSTWRNRIARNKTKTSTEEGEDRDLLLDWPGLNITTLAYVLVDGFSSGKGNGDLVLGRKIASIIDEQFGTRCVIVSNHPTLMKANFPDDQVFWDGTDLSNHMNQNFKKEVKPSDMIRGEFPEPIAFVLCGPQGGNKAKRFTEFPLAYSDNEINLRIPLVKFTEYGCGGHDRVEPGTLDFLGGLGLEGETDIGVFIDRELWKRRGRGRELLQLLREGAAKSEREANEALYKVLTAGNPEERRLYHGYAQGAAYVSLFFDVILADALTHGQDIDLTVPIRYDTSQDVTPANLKLDFAAKDLDVAKLRTFRLKEIRQPLLERHLRLLQLAGVGRVEVVTPKGVTIVYTGKGKRVVRLIDFFRLSNRTFKILLSASDRLCLATGDQSWTEAVSADKDIVYELGHHKERQMAAWKKLALSQEIPADSPMMLLLNLCTTDVFDADLAGPLKLKEDGFRPVAGLDQIVEAVSQASLRSRQFSTLNQAVVEKFDCTRRVVDIMNQAFAAYPVEAKSGEVAAHEGLAVKPGPQPEQQSRKPAEEWKPYGGLEDRYHVLPTVGDGNCLFRAVSRALHGHEDQHQLLRTQAVARIQSKPGIYTDELLDFSSLVPFADRTKYLREMGQTARNAGDTPRYGGHPELAALSALMRRPIHVHSSDPFTEGRGATRVEGDDDDEPGPDAVPIHLLYEGGNHYLALRPRT